MGSKIKEISNSIFDLQNSIKQNIDTSTNIDLIFAKAKYSKSINGSIHLKEKGENILKLINCRHPLLGNNAVPIDIEINNNDPKSIIETIKNIGGTFGGINLEDIAAPDCLSLIHI